MRHRVAFVRETDDDRALKDAADDLIRWTKDREAQGHPMEISLSAIVLMAQSIEQGIKDGMH